MFGEETSVDGVAERKWANNVGGKVFCCQAADFMVFCG